MATNRGIKIRLESVPVLLSKFTFLDTELVQKMHTDIHLYFLEKGKLKSGLQALSKKEDIYEADSNKVKQFLLSLNIPQDKIVRVIWCSTKTGISILFRDFVEYYDDIWYPSSDDVWVTEESLSWLLDFDHEEIVTFTIR